jgi:MscS family membrane protein
MSILKGFINVSGNEKRDYERAAKYLDLSNLPWGLSRRDGAQLARHLKIILDQALWIDLDRLSPVPEGHREDGLPPNRDLVGRIDIEPKPVSILLERVLRGDGVLIWQFASATVAKIPALYEAFGYGYLGEILPAVFFDFEFFGLQVWWWVALLVVGLLAYLVARIVVRVAAFVVRRRQTTMTDQLCVSSWVPVTC